MKKNFELIVKGLIFATFFVPLILLPSSFIFPFIVPKILVLRSLIIFILGAYLILLAINWEQYKPKLNVLSWAVLAFFVSFALSTFLGVDAYHSFWDNHERMLGLFTLFHYVAYFFICAAVFNGWNDWKWALRIFLMAGSIVMFIGILQIGNAELLLNRGSHRINSTLGNPIYVGGYALFLIFTASLLYLKEKSIIWKWVEVALGLMAVLALFYSGTRGSLLGLLVGGGTALLGYLLFLKGYRKVKIVIVVFIIFGLGILGILYANRANEAIKNIPTLGPLLNASFSQGTGTTRVIAWKIAIESWKEQTVFGWGPNNFFYAFNQYYNPQSLEFGYGETWFDNAHNILLNTLTVQGVVGVITYLAVFIAAIFVLLKDKERRNKDLHFVIIGAAFLLAHLAQNVTVFENPTSYLYFIFWLALVASLTTRQKEVIAVNTKTELSNTDQKIGPIVVSSVGLVCLILVFLFNIQPARANIKTLTAMSLVAQNPLLGVPAMEETLAFNSPHIDDIRSDMARIGIQLVSNSQAEWGSELSNKVVDLVVTALEKNVQLHPRDIRNYMMQAQIFQLQFAANGSAQHLWDAEIALNESIKYSPKRQQLLYLLASIKLQLGKTSESVALLEQVISDNPKIHETYWRLAYTYHLVGDQETAKNIIVEALAKGTEFDERGKEAIRSFLPDEDIEL